MSEWIDWKGGVCPVAREARVDVRLRNGRLSRGTAWSFVWGHDSDGTDIVAYRVVGKEPQPVEPSNKDGWIEWKGGQCPVAPDTIVEVKFRSGTQTPEGWNAGYFNWDWGDDQSNDILAYRVVGEQPKPDNVNSPSHYKQGSVECIDAIEAALTPEEFRGYCKGNALKYIWRERHKGGAESIAKAEWYLKRLEAK